MTTAAHLLALYDDQLRGAAEADDGTERDGPIYRRHYAFRGFVSYRNLDGYRGDALDELISRQVAHFAARGEPFEWKTRGHDEPADLTDRLLRQGFVPQERETVVVGDAEAMATEPVLPAGVSLRMVTAEPDLRLIAELESVVWREDWSWLATDLIERVSESPDDIEIFVAEAGDEVVSAAWLVAKPGTDFAGLWGGSTLAAWRGRGIYRALVARRAQSAVRRGVRYLQVDASDDSRPILERLGFVAVTTTTPYIWTPPA